MLLSKSPSIFRGSFALRIILFIIFIIQVLAVERRTPSKTGQQNQHQQQQWFEKGWKDSPANSKSETIYIDDARSRPKYGGGSGDGAVDDLDNSSGYGPDDEDATVDRGSGDSGDSRVDVGSGDVALPPTFVDSRVHATETTSSTTATEPTTAIALWSSTSTMASTSTTSSAYPTPASTTTSTRPSTKPPVIATTIAETDTPRTTSSRRIFDTTTTTRTTTTSVPLTQRATTTEPITRKRPATTTMASTTTRQSHKVSPKLPPLIPDDTNKTSQNFWMRPGVLAGLIGGAVAGLLAAILLVMFVVYRMKKKDEGSYALDEPKSPPAYAYAYQKAPTREFYA